MMHLMGYPDTASMGFYHVRFSGKSAKSLQRRLWRLWGIDPEKITMLRLVP